MCSPQAVEGAERVTKEKETLARAAADQHRSVRQQRDMAKKTQQSAQQSAKAPVLPENPPPAYVTVEAAKSLYTNCVKKLFITRANGKVGELFWDGDVQARLRGLA